MQNLQLVQEAAQELYKNKAGQIVALDMQGMTVICDYMLIAAGRTVNQVKALADDVDERMAELGVPIRRREGQNEGRWIILDYGFMLVHIFLYRGVRVLQPRTPVDGWQQPPCAAV